MNHIPPAVDYGSNRHISGNDREPSPPAAALKLRWIQKKRWATLAQREDLGPFVALFERIFVARRHASPGLRQAVSSEVFQGVELRILLKEGLCIEGCSTSPAPARPEGAFSRRGFSSDFAVERTERVIRRLV